MSDRLVLTGHGLMFRIGYNMTQLRHDLCMTSREAAKRAGISLPKWLKIEVGESNATLRVLSKVCIALGVDLEQLFRELPYKDSTGVVLIRSWP